VVIEIVPVVASVGTVTVTFLSESTVNSDAATPLKLTAVVCVRLAPVICTCVPTRPMPGIKLLNCGVTKNVPLLSVPLGVVTVRAPVVAPEGTLVVISVAETTLWVAAVPLKLT